jgi:FtsP/CotA-like multicopper oxidase with cupredoxin domain
MTTRLPHISRRQFLATSAAAGATLTAGPAFAADGVTSIVALTGEQKLHTQLPPSTLWTYGGAVPGTPLRVKQGAEVAIRLQNKLSQATSIHWHGIRVPNAMDGVPHLTQAPVAAGGFFDYRFRTDDAGTFFYHPHINSTEQMGRGLFAPLIVEEAKPAGVDRDVVWVLNDWRVGRNGQLDNGFSNPHDLSHAGRYGNLVTVNAKPDPVLKGRRNERIRLRLVNASTGRIFALRFGQMQPWVIALDGHPVTPRRVTRDDLLIGPGNRIDLAVDLPDQAGATVHIVDAYYP